MGRKQRGKPTLSGTSLWADHFLTLAQIFIKAPQGRLLVGDIPVYAPGLHKHMLHPATINRALDRNVKNRYLEELPHVRIGGRRLRCFTVTAAGEKHLDKEYKLSWIWLANMVESALFETWFRRVLPLAPGRPCQSWGAKVWNWMPNPVRMITELVYARGARLSTKKFGRVRT